MDFSFFAHMERIDKSQSQIRLYEEFIELCMMAEKGGFSTIWNGEHHGMNFTIAPNPFTNLVDLSHHTNSIKLGTQQQLVQQRVERDLILQVQLVLELLQVGLGQLLHN